VTPSLVADIVNRHVTKYFMEISHGAYAPSFRAASTIAVGPSDSPQACVDAALSLAADDARGVLVVSDAELAADEPGGFGTMGDECAAPPCGASESRRAVFVGASDFHPDWGQRPPMDLLQHELGHALGWPHSGYDPSLAAPHQSGLDVMSNSASPRSVDAERRDAPDTLAVNRVVSGWMDAASVTVLPVAPFPATDIALQPSTAPNGLRLAIVALPDDRFLAIEWLTDDGFNDHLPAAGAAVHLVEGEGGDRLLTPLVGSAPYLDLLQPGEQLDFDSLRIEVLGVGTVRVSATSS
jgi:hypothetical protein